MLERFGSRWMALLGLVVVATPALLAREKLELRHSAIHLPGAPVVVLPTDLDRDGVQDLVVAVAYTEWDQIGIDELSEMRGVEGLVMVMTVVPVVMDRREIRFYRGQKGGGYSDDIAPLPIDLTVLSLDLGPREAPIILLTDTGVNALRLSQEASGPRLSTEPLVNSTPVLARSGALIPHLGLSHDLDGDGDPDLMVPVNEGLDLYLAAELASSWDTSDRASLPGDRSRLEGVLSRFYPMPVIRDVNGDKLPDLLVPDPQRGWNRFEVLINLGAGRFDEASSPLPDGPVSEERYPVVYFGDLDGDGVAEYVTQEELDDPDAGWRKEMKEAKRPPRRYRIHRSEADLVMSVKPTQTFEALGYAFDLTDSEIMLPGGFKDLDGDGRQDLVSLTLNFSILQAVRIMTTQRLSIGLDFHVLCQDAVGRFFEVQGMDLSGKFKLDLNNLQLGQLSQFAGDFDGDGRIDFLQVGRGKTVTIHRGQEGCRYPSTPDLTLKLEEPPLDLGLVHVQDLNADGLSDLMIVQPDHEPEPGVSAPVRLDLYLSGGSQ